MTLYASLGSIVDLGELRRRRAKSELDHPLDLL